MEVRVAKVREIWFMICCDSMRVKWGRDCSNARRESWQREEHEKLSFWRKLQENCITESRWETKEFYQPGRKQGSQRRRVKCVLPQAVWKMSEFYSKHDGGVCQCLDTQAARWHAQLTKIIPSVGRNIWKQVFLHKEGL